MMIRVDHTICLKISEQLQWGEEREKKEKERKKETSKTHQSSNYNTTSIIKKISMRQIQ